MAADLTDVLGELVTVGFTLALGNFSCRPGYEPLLRPAKIAKLSVQALTPEELAQHVRRLRDWDLRIIAEKVETREQLRLPPPARARRLPRLLLRAPAVMAERSAPTFRLDALARLLDGDAVGPEPARGEAQRLERRLVEPLHLVGHAQHRPLLGREGEQAAAARRRSPAGPGAAAGSSSSAPASAASLGGRQPVAQRRAPARTAPPGRRTASSRLALEAARAQHGHAVGALDRRVAAARSCRSRAGRGARARRCHPRGRCSSARSTRSSSASRPISTSGRVSQAPPALSLGLSERQTEIPYASVNASLAYASEA